MLNWLWDNVVLPALGLFIEGVPWPIWIIVGAVLLGWAWKQFGWQGLLLGAIAALSLGSYGKGWKDAVARHKNEKGFENTDDPFSTPTPPKSVNKRKTLADIFKEFGN